MAADALSTLQLAADSSTLVNKAILRRSTGSKGRLERHNKISGS
jgi:hypothetical protein